MFMDISQAGGPGGEPHIPTCKSCKGLISPGNPVEKISFPANGDARLQKLNGEYHPHCAAPILSVKRAFDKMGRLGGF